MEDVPHDHHDEGLAPSFSSSASSTTNLPSFSGLAAPAATGTEGNEAVDAACRDPCQAFLSRSQTCLALPDESRAAACGCSDETSRTVSSCWGCIAANASPSSTVTGQNATGGTENAQLTPDQAISQFNTDCSGYAAATNQEWTLATLSTPGQLSRTGSEDGGARGGSSGAKKTVVTTGLTAATFCLVMGVFQ
ncbi:hypothetical protein JCM8547_007600 [Rhodosporidiobolus lusitaniae]